MELRRSSSTAWLLSVLLGGLLLGGCDDPVEVQRDPEIHIAKGMTWAWRPMKEPESAKRGTDGRPITSRDVIKPAPPAPTQKLESNRDWNNEANRALLHSTIERAMHGKGLLQASDPASADLLVDYHVAVKDGSAVVQNVYPACGPYGCWGGYGYYGWGWGPPEVYFRNVSWQEGTFVLDLALRDPRKLAYRAIGHKQLNNKSSITPYQAEQTVNSLLKSLKPQ